jgi:site-specific recombinase XerD
VAHITLADAIAAFLLQLDADGRSLATRTQYKRGVTSFARWKGESTSIRTITTADLATFMTTPQARGETRPKRPSSVNGLRTSLRMLFSFCHASGMVQQNPARLLRRALCSAGVPRTLSASEIERLTAALLVAQGPIARRDHMLIDLLLSAGLRIGSALALDKCDIDLERGEVLLRATKRQRVECVPISRDLQDHLVGFLAKRRAGAVFTTSTGGRLGQRQAGQRIKKWFARAGVNREATPHWLRHTFATRLYARTHDLAVVQRALCHAAIASTLVYSRASDVDLRRALDA